MSGKEMGNLATGSDQYACPELQSERAMRHASRDRTYYDTTKMHRADRVLEQNNSAFTLTWTVWLNFYAQVK
jgi:hypothetical protein